MLCDEFTHDGIEERCVLAEHQVAPGLRLAEDPELEVGNLRRDPFRGAGGGVACPTAEDQCRDGNAREDVMP